MGEAQAFRDERERLRYRIAEREVARLRAGPYLLDVAISKIVASREIERDWPEDATTQLHRRRLPPPGWVQVIGYGTRR